MFVTTNQSVSEIVPVKTKIDIEKIVKTNLPPLPETALRISELLKKENVSNSALANVIGYDPLLATRILQLANSPIYHQQKNITSIQQALDVVGTQSLYDIVIMGITADIFAKEISNTKFGRTIWEHSLAVALIAKELDQVLGSANSDEAFICGLLHDIGKIMLLRADTMNYLNILGINNETEMLAAERFAFGYNHSQIGALVVRRWQLPDNVCYVILNHHDASQAYQAVTMAHIVNTADLVANFNGYGLRREPESAFLNSESVQFLQLTPEKLNKVWENIQTNLTNVIATLT